MNDYTTDKRGDIGSIVREASMIAQANILKNYTKSKRQGSNQVEITSKMMYDITVNLLQQLAEKIDRVRLVAGSVLQEIFDNLFDELPDFPHKYRLRDVFCKENIKEIVKRDQNKFDLTFETEVIRAELTYFILDDTNRESDDYIYYWNQPNATYPIIVPLLELPEYSYHLVIKICLLYLYQYSRDIN